MIEINHLSKQYRLGAIGTGSLRDDISRFWARIRKLDDPTAKVGLNNILAQEHVTSVSKTVWALKDVNLSIEKGEIVGIIGKNGAGKSTLLKLLSKVTAPTSGTIKLNGRVASLLELGTGFHPELTGRENIYLNGVILGLTRLELNERIEDIVEFSGIEKYIDTPVKRYSSGMILRLGFAVAAFLDSEILVVDEILAVGDSEFQKKCIGKMSNIANEGRTVLFVSHNMSTILGLCKKAVLMNHGEIVMTGDVKSVVKEYLHTNLEVNNSFDLRAVEKHRKGNGHIRFTHYQLLNENNEAVEYVMSGDCVKFLLYVEMVESRKYDSLHCSIQILSHMDEPLFHLNNSAANGVEFKLVEGIQTACFSCVIPELPLQPDLYKFHLYLDEKAHILDNIEYAGELKVEAGDFYKTGKLPYKDGGHILVNHKWYVEQA